ncbi:hypothetical protein [Nostoc commune]|uniref:hypothetical protein n=1 Tax=Nostoc commune TaxID=1178 RepID=UPI0018C51079|nr:hypothetical protein [Nostoc commune]MBG1263085.1 hypothetical protein [Nostoc commune BAE]
MEKINGKERPPQLSNKPQDRQLKVRVGSLGTVSDNGSRDGTYKIAVSGENSDKSNILVEGQQPLSGIPGKIVGQLIHENEKQLAYHEEQAQLIKDRIRELKQIPETLADVNHTE